MPLLSILRYPDPRLERVAAPVTAFDDPLRSLVADMAETMYAAPGVGLAATQVDVHKRLIVIDISDTHDQLLVLANPVLVEALGQSDLEEGCLSVPGIYDHVARAEGIRVRAQDAEGQFFEREAGGLLSVCIQHEMDHLLGIVFVSYLSRLKQSRIRGRMKKLRSAL